MKRVSEWDLSRQFMHFNPSISIKIGVSSFLCCWLTSKAAWQSRLLCFPVIGGCELWGGSVSVPGRSLYTSFWSAHAHIGELSFPASDLRLWMKMEWRSLSVCPQDTLLCRHCGKNRVMVTRYSEGYGTEVKMGFIAAFMRTEQQTGDLSWAQNKEVITAEIVFLIKKG